MAGPGNRSDDSVVWDWIIEMTLTWGVWIATGSLVGLGLIGTIVPFLPGHLLIFGAAFIPFFSLPDRGEKFTEREIARGSLLRCLHEPRDAEDHGEAVETNQGRHGLVMPFSIEDVEIFTQLLSREMLRA
ncbi:hypothetical protein OAF32_02640 [Akkermansiaceae bacterium]|nr:hypothetical protein [Akkermansiaceae bacterium]